MSFDDSVANQPAVMPLLFAAGMSAWMLLAIRAEEKDLIAVFGRDYEEYRAQVGMLAPGIDPNRWQPLAFDVALVGSGGSTITQAEARRWLQTGQGTKRLPNGKLPMDILLQTAAHNEWEMDVAWVIRGGADPLAWIEKDKDRITAAHVKDIAPQGLATDEDGWSDVGHGTVDWAGLVTALRKNTPAKYFVMEHDNPKDDARFATRSIASAKAF